MYLCIEKRSQNSHFRLNFFSFSIFIIQFRPFSRPPKSKYLATEGLQNKTKFFISAPHRVSDAVAKHDELGETDERDSFRVSSRCFCVKRRFLRPLRRRKRNDSAFFNRSMRLLEKSSEPGMTPRTARKEPI